MAFVIQLLVYGLQLGSIYALLAIGYTMVYGIIGMINLAHADFMMLGAFIVYFLTHLVFMGTVEAIGQVVLLVLLGMALTGVFGTVTERIAYKPLRNRPKVSSLVAAIGVSMFIQNFLRAIPEIGPTPRPFPVLFRAENIQVGFVQISAIQIIVIVTSILLMVCMTLLVNKTKIGKQMLAVSCDKDAASLMGINVNKVISVTFFLGAALAGICGVLYSSVYPSIEVAMGVTIGNKAFISAVLGGIGNIKGAMIGGLILGIAEVFATSVNSELAYGVSFVILILILLYKPAGILGKVTTEKV